LYMSPACINTRDAPEEMAIEKQTKPYILIKLYYFISVRPADFLLIIHFLRTAFNSSYHTMCHQTAPRHPSCGHAAHGTAVECSKLEICRTARSRNTRCKLSWKLVDVARAYCDHCIAHGEILAQRRGLDAGIYCQRFNVSYTDLGAANPGVFPDALHDPNNQHQTFPKQQNVMDDQPVAISQYVGKTSA